MTPNPFALRNPEDPESDEEQRDDRTSPSRRWQGGDTDSPSVQLLRELQGTEHEGNAAEWSANGADPGEYDPEVFHSTIGLNAETSSGDEGERQSSDPTFRQETARNQLYSMPALKGDLSNSSSSPFNDRTPSSSTFQTLTPTAISPTADRRRTSQSSPPRGDLSALPRGGNVGSYIRSDSGSPPPDLLSSPTARRPSKVEHPGHRNRVARGVARPSLALLSPGNSSAIGGQAELDDALLEEGHAVQITDSQSEWDTISSGREGHPNGARKEFGRSGGAGNINSEGKQSGETIRAGTPPTMTSSKTAGHPTRSGKYTISSTTEHHLDDAQGDSTKPAKSSLLPSHSHSQSTEYLSSSSKSPAKRLSKSSRSSRRGKSAARTGAEPYADDDGFGPEPELNFGRAARGLSPRERAMWGWVNVVDLDGYLQEVYEYYVGKGIYCIIVRKVLNLLTSGFVIIFSTFLLSCIDYSRFPSDGNGMLRDVIVEHCASRWSTPHLILTWIFGFFFVWKLGSFALSVPRLMELKRFYEFLLSVPNEDIQTVSWPEVVRRIGQIKQDNPTTSVRTADNASDGFLPEGEVIKLDAHDVANRIMRQENYLIALFNKDLLDLRLSIPVPSAFAGLVPESSLRIDTNGPEEIAYFVISGTGLTQTLEWNLRYCLIGELFDDRGLVKKEYIRGRNRKLLVARLRRRFVFMGILNAIFAPFIVVYFLMYSFFRYFEEYHKNPSSIGSRKYTQYARWKFREFNELPHLFDRRLDESYVMAKRYIDQFPKELTALSMRFVAFVAGAFAAVLGLLSVIDPVFLHYEITANRTVLFYLGLFTSVLAVSRGMVPPSNLVFDPELLMTEVVWYTHYMPDEWQGQLHSKAVHAQFGTLFQMKLATFVSELVSVLITPFILWFSLPRCAGEIVDFFREFTIHVEGLGYVCSFAVFDFKRKGVIKSEDDPTARRLPGLSLGVPTGDSAGMEQARAKSAARKGSTARSGSQGHRNQETDSMIGRESKMEKSFLHFKVTHPDWQPSDPSSSMLLSRLADESSTMTPSSHTETPDQPAVLFPSHTARSSGSSGAAYPSGSLGARSRLMDPSSDVDRERRLREKSSLYEKALQRSIMLHGSGTLAGAGSGSGMGRSKMMTRVGQLPGADRFVNGRSGESASGSHHPHHGPTGTHRMAMTMNMNDLPEEEDERASPSGRQKLHRDHLDQGQDVALNDLSTGEVEDGWLTKGNASTSASALAPGSDSDGKRADRSRGGRPTGLGTDVGGETDDRAGRGEDVGVVNLLRHVMKP